MHQVGDTVHCLVTSKINGGFEAVLEGARKNRAFVPQTLMDKVTSKNDGIYLGQSFNFKVIKVKGGNVVVSRKAILEEGIPALREEMRQIAKTGQVIHGIVKTIRKYGVFVDVGGIDGLLHLSDMAWERIEDPHTVVQLGQSIDVRVLRVDDITGRVSLTLKDPKNDPWNRVEERYTVGSVWEGRITNVMDYGAFVEVEKGIEGLVHISSMPEAVHASLVKHNAIKVVVRSLDMERRRIEFNLSSGA